MYHVPQQIQSSIIEKQIQKLKDLPNTCLSLSTNNSLKISDQKNSSLGMENRTKEPQDPKCKNWIWTKYSGRKKLKQNWKKAIRFKLLEFCKTGTKKSSPDLFNFYVDLAGNDMVNDAGQTTTCRRKFKTPWLQTKVQKMKDHPKMSLTEKRSKIPDGKKNHF